MNIDILGTPPTKEDIAAKRNKVLDRRKRNKIISLLSLVIALLIVFLPIKYHMSGIGDPLFLILLLCMLISSAFSLISYEDELKIYQNIEQSTCIDIAKYMSHPDIAVYRNRVLEQDREFIEAEVDAMKEYFEGEEARQACRTVYGLSESNLNHSE